MTSRRSFLWLAAFAVAFGALVFGSIDEGEPRTNSDRAYALANRYACPVCNGQSVAESDVPIARTIRAEIRTRVDAGETDEQITDYLVRTNGDDIDLNPSASGITGLVWMLPVIAVTAAVAALAMAFRRWQQVPLATATKADEDLVARARRTEAEDPRGSA